MKKSQIQQAIDNVNAEIDELMKVRTRLEAVRSAGNVRPKRERKAVEKPKAAKSEPAVSRSLSETH